MRAWVVGLLGVASTAWGQAAEDVAGADRGVEAPVVAAEAPVAAAEASVVVAEASVVAAEPAPPTVVAAPAPVAEAPAPKPPYSLPWQLRPLAAGKVVRLDNSFDLASSGQADVVVLNVAWTFHPRMYVLARLGGVFNGPMTGAAGSALTNLLAGGMYLHPLGDFRLGAFAGVTAPTAGGGGDTPDVGAKAANGAAILARASMDNALFAVNDFVVLGGLGLSWVKHGFTAQAEVTVLELLRVRGAAVQADAAKTNFTSGLHVGYFVTPQFSLGAELRYQRWLSTPAAVAKNEALRQNLNAAVGARVHVKAGALMLRPGVSLTRGLAGTMVPASHTVVQLDVPVALP